MTRRNVPRCGFTLIELLVTLFIDAASVGTLPPGRCWNGYSLYAPLLAHLDQSALYNSLNSNVWVSIAYDYPSGLPIDAHYTAAVTRLGVLVCPSDRAPSWVSATTNYAGNVGLGFQGTRAADAGGFDVSSTASVTIAEVVDGPSNTVAVSEWVLGEGLGVSWEPLGNIYPIPATADFDRFVEACDSSIGVIPPESNGKRCFWLQTDLAHTLYNHNQGVGKPSCDNGNAIPNGSWTAASRHPGGINSLAVDGHVSFFKNTMARDIWRGLGTRAGGEAISVSD